MSTDNGTTWDNLPGLGGEALPAGLAPALTSDDADNVYVVDTYLVDASFSRYHLAGRGRVSATTNPAIGTVGLDTAPILAAHGDGRLVYFAKGDAGPVAAGVTAYASANARADVQLRLHPAECGCVHRGRGPAPRLPPGLRGVHVGTGASGAVQLRGRRSDVPVDRAAAECR